jgi:hypothetical protein
MKSWYMDGKCVKPIREPSTLTHRDKGTSLSEIGADYFRVSSTTENVFNRSLATSEATSGHLSFCGSADRNLGLFMFLV